MARLSEDSRSLPAESAYHYGTFFDLFGVGEECKPFPILDDSRFPHRRETLHSGQETVPVADRGCSSSCSCARR
ncbi:hypothetical protein QR77_01880 [Streptomyces sp. 150FB]|uniref:hypothetical protein n=1 Tax=Streptomyces sp. 150FB TaxID=1576605 RepID=UPI0005891839|nr:hypothetical protein [Streptomyces sp. 150FB]KIF73079.1 hypothetical protein QR77_01880 [Streptomyces sp. 150FB]